MDSHAAGVIVAPFHDPVIEPTLQYELRVVGGSDVRLDALWCWTRIRWQRAKAQEPVADVRVPLSVSMDRYDRVIAAITVPIIPRVARVVRSSALTIVNMPYIEATRAVGSGAVLEPAPMRD